MGRSHYIPRREEDTFDLAMGGGGSQPDCHVVGRAGVGDSDYAISLSWLPIGKLHLVPGGDRGLGDSGVVWKMLRESFRKKWDEGDSFLCEADRRLYSTWAQELLVSEAPVFPQLFPRVKSQRNKV